MERPSLFKLNDRSIDFYLTDQLEFTLGDQKIDFILNAITEPDVNFRLLEDGFKRLLENGGFRLLE